MSPPWERHSHLPPKIHFNSESPTNFAERGSSAVKKRLFRTPATQQRSGSRDEKFSPRTPSILNASVTNRYFLNKNPAVTPNPLSSRVLSRAKVSTARVKPSVTRLEATPSVRRKYVATAPDMWRAMQTEDLTTWLNSILEDQAIESAITGESLALSPTFRKQVLQMCDLYKSSNVNRVLGKVDAEVKSGRFFVSRKISLATHLKEREQLVSLLLLNYHPMWLLLGLSTVLSCNFGTNIDSAFKELANDYFAVDKDRVFMAVLEQILLSSLLADDVDTPLMTSTSMNRRVSIKSRQRDRCNGIVLRRVLHLILLLDRAKQAKVPIIPCDPPLFRIGSGISSSQEIIQQLGRDLLPDHGDVVRFLNHRGFRVSYDTPLFERNNLIVKNLEKDLSDGIRLCKLASMLIKDRSFLSKVRRVTANMPRKAVYSCHLANVSLAMNKMEEYANVHLSHPFRWAVSHQDVVAGDLNRIIIFMWQVTSLWLQINVLDVDCLEKELEKVKEEFRRAKRLSSNEDSDENMSPVIPDLNDKVISPSRLMVYEDCETKAGHLLLKWCATVAGMYGIAVRDFTESFRDGAPLCIILHHYFPELIKTDEFTRVQQAELRSMNDSLAESEIVQKNLDLFTTRARILGGIPGIRLRADAALAPPFTCEEKEASFGRVMELLSAYMFKRLAMEGQGNELSDDLNDLLLQQRLSSDEFAVATCSPESHDPNHFSFSPNETHAELCDINENSNHLMNDSGTTEVSDDIQMLLTDKRVPVQNTRKKVAENLDYATNSTTMILNSPECLPSNDNSNDDNNATTSTVSSLSQRKKNAARSILEFYRTAKARRAYIMKKEACILIQKAFRKREAEGMRIVLSQKARQTPLSSDALSNTMHESPLASLPSSGVEDRKETYIFASRNVLNQTMQLFPMMNEHMAALEAFVGRMMDYERNRAASFIQRSLRAHMSATHAVELVASRDISGFGESGWHKLKSNTFSIVRNAAKQLLIEIEAQRVEYMRLVSSALCSAENAYEKEMARRTQNSSRVRNEYQNQQLERNNIRRNLLEQEREIRNSFEQDLKNLQQEQLNLERKFETESIALSSKPHDLEVSYDNDEIACETVDQNDNIHPCPENDIDPTDSLDQLLSGKTLLKEIETARKEDNIISAQLDKLEQTFADQCNAREQELTLWKKKVLHGVHITANHAFDLHISLCQTERSNSEKKYADFCANMENLATEENATELDMASETKELEERFASLEKHCDAIECSMGEETKKILNNLSTADDAIATLESVFEKSEDAEIEWNASIREFDDDVRNESENFISFDRWCTVIDSADTLYNEQLENMEMEENRRRIGEKLTSRLARAEQRFSFVMQSAASEAAKRQAELEKQKAEQVQQIAEAAEIKGEFDEGLSILNRDLQHLENAMDSQAVHIRSLETPARNPRALSPMIRQMTSYHPESASLSTPLRNLGEDIGRTLELIDAERSSDTLDIHPSDLVGCGYNAADSTRIEEEEEKDASQGTYAATPVKSGAILQTPKQNHPASTTAASVDRMSPSVVYANNDSNTAINLRSPFTGKGLDEINERRTSMLNGFEFPMEAQAMYNDGSLPNDHFPIEVQSQQSDLGGIDGTSHRKGSSSTFGKSPIPIPLSQGEQLSPFKTDANAFNTPTQEDAPTPQARRLQNTFLEPRHIVGVTSDRTPSSKSDLVSSFLRANAFRSLEKADTGSKLKLPLLSPSETHPAGREPDIHKIGTPVLQGLSRELSDLHREFASGDRLEHDAKTHERATPLNDVLRRISIASSTHMNIDSIDVVDQYAEETSSLLEIVQTICLIIRQCRRSEGHVQLVQMGVSIIRDVCNTEWFMECDMISEDFIAVFVTCVQFYRNRETILASAVDILLAISRNSRGLRILARHENFLPRLQAVSRIMALEIEREAQNRERLRRADVILMAIDNRRENGACNSFAAEIAKAERNIPCVDPKMPRSVELLTDLLRQLQPVEATL